MAVSQRMVSVLEEFLPHRQHVPGRSLYMPRSGGYSAQNHVDVLGSVSHH